MALFSTAAIIGAAAIGGAAVLGASAMASRSQEKAAEQAQEAARQQAASQERIAQEQIAATERLGEEQRVTTQEAAEKARVSAEMTPEEKAFTSMMRGRAETGLGAPEFETTTAAETEKALEALQKYYMQRGFQPSPAQTGLLIEPSQKVARDIAIQNALLKRQAQQQAWERAYALTPLQQRNIEQQAGLQTLGPEIAGTTAGYGTEAAGLQTGFGLQAQAAATPYTSQQALALQRMEQATTQQQALGNLLGAYASPLLQQRIAAGGGSTITGGQAGGSYGYNPQYGQTWSPYR